MTGPQSPASHTSLSASERRSMEERRLRDALLHIARDRALRSADLREAFAVVAESVAVALDAGRAGIWLLSADGTTLACSTLWERGGGRRASGGEITVADHPDYFDAIDSDRAMAVCEAASDPRTAELHATSLEPNGVTSMLDAAVRRGGRLAGVLRVEHKGEPRHWTSEEAMFLASAADLTAVALEAADRRRVEDALRRSEERYRGFIDLSVEGIWRLDADPPIPVDLPVGEQVRRIMCEARFAECNRAYARMHGLDDRKEIVGKTMADLVLEERYASLVEFTVRSGYRVADLEIGRHDQSGRMRWFSLNISGIVRNGLLIHFWGVQREITDRVRYIEALEHRATHDALTDLRNRAWLLRQLEELETRGPAAGVAALLLLDLDGFREVNDALSHEAGDILLRAVADRLRAIGEKQRIAVARFGGDEFGFLMESARDAVHVAGVAEAILETLRAPFDVGGIRLELGGSIGIALFPSDAADGCTLLRRAEIAMYTAKGELRKYDFYSPARDPHDSERLALVAGLGAAIRQREFVLYYQPKIDLRDDSLSGFEALVRWHHPKRGVVLPADFISWAEKSDLIRPFTSNLLEQGIARLSEWNRRGMKATLAINLSPRNLLDERVAEEIRQLLRTYDVAPGSFLVEITESSMMSDPERALDTIRRIDDLGVRLSIDDFGTGYSSLAYLKRLPVDELKIDISFVTHMLRNPSDRTIVRATIDLAHNLGFVVTAEGVEDEATLEELRRMQCDYAQGYFLGRPMPCEALENWLARRAGTTTARPEIESEPMEGYTLFVYRGAFTDSALHALAGRLIDDSRGSANRRVMVDLTESVGVADDFGIAARFELAERFARQWPRDVRLAILGHEGQDDPGRIWELAAVNRGLDARIFFDREAATAWLLA
ncbi:MAG TPA: EAL domain-containing protein [Thermoanaerobaculia bacterium]|nr:EAL domain-containing protein [Thermoanaerobaculia bacterium]